MAVFYNNIFYFHEAGEERKWSDDIKLNWNELLLISGCLDSNLPLVSNYFSLLKYYAHNE